MDGENVGARTIIDYD